MVRGSLSCMHAIEQATSRANPIDKCPGNVGCVGGEVDNQCGGPGVGGAIAPVQKAFKDL